MNSGLRFETHSDEATRELGRQLAHRLPAAGVVLLIGELGAGKTTLTKGIAEGRGVAAADEVSSPTFTLICIGWTRRTKCSGWGLTSCLTGRLWFCWNGPNAFRNCCRKSGSKSGSHIAGKTTG